MNRFTRVIRWAAGALAIAVASLGFLSPVMAQERTYGADSAIFDAHLAYAQVYGEGRSSPAGSGLVRESNGYRQKSADSTLARDALG